MRSVQLMSRKQLSLHDSERDDFTLRLNDLHETLYRRGGIKPVNAAIEELSKLLLLMIKRDRTPDWPVPGAGPIATVLDPRTLRREQNVAALKTAFREILRLDEFGARLPDGGSQPIWPLDEPIRIERADIAAEALEILAGYHRSRDNGFDPLGTAFDVFLRGRYDNAGGLATYLTPATVATHLARLTLADLDLLSSCSDEHPIFGDPCCGTGRFLIAVLQELARDLESQSPDAARRRQFETFKQRGLFGADQSASSVAKARINLLLYGIEHPNVFTVEDSVTDPHVRSLFGRLHLILTNPPFGDGKYDSEEGIQHAARTLPRLSGRKRIDPALAFFALCLDLLADGGRLGIILPEGLVDGPSLRAALLSSFHDTRLRDVSVEANISLPPVTFALAGTVARTSALVIRKQAASRSHVFLARAEHVGYLKQGTLAVPDPAGDDLTAIAEAGIRASSDAPLRTNGLTFISQKPVAALVPAADLQTLDPARIDAEAVAAHVALRKSGAQEFRTLLVPAEPHSSRGRVDRPFVSVLHVDDLGVVAWDEALAYSPTTPGVVAHSGQLIVSLLNPKKLRATVIPDDVEVVACSSEFGVFATNCDPYEVLVLLHHPLVRAQLAPLGRGTSSSRRRIDEEDVLNIYAPQMPALELRKRARALRTLMSEMRRTRLGVAAALTGDYSSSE